MKDLNRYIKESLLDDEDDLVGNNDFVITQKLKEDIFDIIHTVKDVVYSNGVLNIIPTGLFATEFNSWEFLRIKDIAPEIHTVKSSTGISFRGNLDPDYCCKNIEGGYFQYDGPVIRDVNIKSNKHYCTIICPLIENTNIDIDGGLIRFYREWPVLRNVTSNAEEIYIRINSLFKSNIPAYKILNELIDNDSILRYWDERAGEYKDLKVKKITDIINKVKNTKRYNHFKNLIKFKNNNFIKELGLDKFKNLNKIILCDGKSAIQFTKEAPLVDKEYDIIGQVGNWWIRISEQI